MYFNSLRMIDKINYLLLLSLYLIKLNSIFKNVIKTSLETNV